MQKEEFVSALTVLTRDYNALISDIDEAVDNAYGLCYGKIDLKRVQVLYDMLYNVKEKITYEFEDDVQALYDSAVMESE